jgi:hypothetical protein
LLRRWKQAERVTELNVSLSSSRIRTHIWIDVILACLVRSQIHSERSILSNTTEKCFVDLVVFLREGGFASVTCETKSCGISN